MAHDRFLAHNCLAARFEWPLIWTSLVCEPIEHPPATRTVQAYSLTLHTVDSINMADLDLAIERSAFILLPLAIPILRVHTTISLSSLKFNSSTRVRKQTWTKLRNATSPLALLPPASVLWHFSFHGFLHLGNPWKPIKTKKPGNFATHVRFLETQNDELWKPIEMFIYD